MGKELPQSQFLALPASTLVSSMMRDMLNSHVSKTAINHEI